MSLIRTGAMPMWDDGGAIVTDPLWLPARGRSKATGGTERTRFTLTWGDVILARLWMISDNWEKDTELRQRRSKEKITEPVKTLGRKRTTWINHEPHWLNWIPFYYTQRPLSQNALWLEATFRRRKLNILVSEKWKTQRQHSLCVKGYKISKRKAEHVSAWNLDVLLTDKTSVSVMFQNVFQKWTSRFWVIRSNSIPLNSGSMAYFPEVKKELAATPAEKKNVT